MELASGRQTLAEVKTQRGIFQGDSLSPLLIVITMVPLNYIFGKVQRVAKLTKSEEKIYHLMYMSDIKVFSKKEKELVTLIQTIKIYIQNIGMEFGMEKCAMLIRKSVEKETTKRIELPYQKSIRTLEGKENYKY